ncbi:hypothetical protein [Mongoliitalea daihaiensis]|uniref:hypothetical protein n=1 Tax=Mongoliitalea daihaiensis TaxID=2782006 RepID=UPI001F2BEE94|nr:hypothetical protein [Mongoliitalea daihaiensis]UJP65694.1 hypothetical protein IPZ59_03455 [Mongoliitalea daihaiensis]
MNSLNKIELKYFFALSSFIFFGFLMSGNTLAQSDKDRNMPDVPKSADVVNFETVDASYVEGKDGIGSKPAPAKIPAATPSAPVVKKENPLFKQGSDKEQVKKESMSTLSFNLFLYIVDKFRED